MALDRAAAMILAARRLLIMLGAAASRPRSTVRLSGFVRRLQIPFFTTQMGKGTVPGGGKLYMGTAALSECDYVHEAVDQADLIIAIGHDTIEKLPFIMGPGGPQVIHVGYMPANVEQVYFPHAEVVGDVGPSLELLADRVEGKLHYAGALLSLRDGVVQIRVTRETWNPLVGAALATFGVTHKPPVLNHARPPSDMLEEPSAVPLRTHSLLQGDARPDALGISCRVSGW